MRIIPPLALSLALVFAGSMAMAKPPLREVKEIDQNMLWVAIAIEVSDECKTIKPRTAKGLSYLWGLKSKASKLGYSDDEIRAYIESDAEEKRIRSLGEAYIRAAGFDPKTKAGLCAFGEAEIARGSIIGSFLRSTK